MEHDSLDIIYSYLQTDFQRGAEIIYTSKLFLLSSKPAWLLALAVSIIGVWPFRALYAQHAYILKGFRHTALAK